MIGSATAIEAGERAVDGDEDDGGAVRAQRVAASSASGAASTPCAAISRAPPTAIRRPSTSPGDALADQRAKPGGVRERQPALAGGADDGVGQRVLAGALQAGGQPQQLGLVDAGDRARSP